MITKFEAYDQGFEYEEIDLYRDIYSTFRSKQKDYYYVINNLQKFKNKYVSFCSREYTSETSYSCRIHNGFVENVAYDNDGGNRIIYIQLRGEKKFWAVDPETSKWSTGSNAPILVNLTRTDMEKYNL